ncbi:hypothetical protein Mjas_06815 [Methanothermococcus sp. Ax23]|uniref:hypothetical protein n=1 Tax=Methanothermococcus sp. Ax23 TaxID=3156486 RepID=UPI003B9F875E
MAIPFFRSKSSKLKKLLEEGRLLEAQKLVENNTSLMDSLMGLIDSNNPKIVSNSVYLTTKIFLKHGKNVKNLMPYIKKCLRSNNENLVLNTLISLKIILLNNPEYFNVVEKELWNINEKFVNLQIREYAWELIRKYGEIPKSESESRPKSYERIRLLKDSLKQNALIKKLLNTGLSLINFDKVDKIDITEEKINSSIRKDDLKGTLKVIKSGDIDKLSPLNIAYCLSTISTLNEEELEEIIENVLKLLFNENDVIRYTTLNTIYEISKYHPDVIYKNIDALKKYCKIYGKSTIVDLILKEISKKYDLEEIY